MRATAALTAAALVLVSACGSSGSSGDETIGDDGDLATTTTMAVDTVDAVDEGEPAGEPSPGLPDDVGVRRLDRILKEINYDAQVRFHDPDALIPGVVDEAGCPLFPDLSELEAAIGDFDGADYDAPTFMATGSWGKDDVVCWFGELQIDLSNSRDWTLLEQMEEFPLDAPWEVTIDPTDAEPVVSYTSKTDDEVDRVRAVRWIQGGITLAISAPIGEGGFGPDAEPRLALERVAALLLDSHPDIADPGPFSAPIDGPDFDEFFDELEALAGGVGGTGRDFGAECPLLGVDEAEAAMAAVDPTFVGALEPRGSYHSSEVVVCVFASTDTDAFFGVSADRNGFRDGQEMLDHHLRYVDGELGRPGYGAFTLAVSVAGLPDSATYRAELADADDFPYREVVGVISDRLRVVLWVVGTQGEGLPTDDALAMLADLYPLVRANLAAP